MKRLTSVLLLFGVVSGAGGVAFGYSKPGTCKKDHSESILQDQYHYSPHGWIIEQAIALLREDGLTTQADLAESYLLPMIEGVTFNDVWGDADLAGASVLDYYIPDRPDENYGFGTALLLYKNSTQSYREHPFYGYGNAAEYAQFRYEYARRIYLGEWGSDPRDRMAGWVIDVIDPFSPLTGQEDPQDGRYAHDGGEIDAGGFEVDIFGIPIHTPSRFGDGQRPATVFTDLSQGFGGVWGFPTTVPPAPDGQPFFVLPTADVFAQDGGVDWLDNHYGNADSIEAYCGWDGHDSAVYANWTYDAGGTAYSCSGIPATNPDHLDTCDAASPMVVRLPVGSKAHAFFQLGWSIHLLEDVTTPVHTISGSILTALVHNDVEKVADLVLAPPFTRTTLPGTTTRVTVKDGIPTRSRGDFEQLFPFPPPVIEQTTPDLDCGVFAPDPGLPPYFRARWYADSLDRFPDEGVAHAYVRDSAELTHTFVPYIVCMEAEPNHASWDWDHMGFFTAFGLDLAVKSTAGLIRHFIEEVDTTAPAVTIAQPTAAAFVHTASLTLAYSASDTEAGVASIAATMDGQPTLTGRPLENGRVISLLGEFPTPGDHTFAVSSVDHAGNTGTASVTFSIIVTVDSLKEDVRAFVASQAITQDEGNSLLRKLDSAAKARAKGDCANAASILTSFISEVRALTGKKIAAAAATTLIADAGYLIAHCP